MTFQPRSMAIRLFLPAAALLLVGLPGVLLAQGGPASPPAGQAPSQPASPAVQWGTQFFDQAVQYVARGRSSIPSIRDFYANLDAKIELDTSHQEGRMRIWLLAPTMFRQELTTNNATTTKILNGDLGWILTPNGGVQNLALSAEGQRTIRQLKEDRDRLSDLASFLTLQSLKGPGVVFTFEGYKRGSGTYAGNWIKVTRSAPGRPNISFWLAYTRNAQNQTQATWPGIVRVDGDPARGYPTEDYILKEWDSPQSAQARDFRYPRKIEAYSILRAQNGQMQPMRFLFAIVDDIKINAGIDQSRFQPHQ